MKTIAMCMVLAALAFGLLPGRRAEREAKDPGLVLLVEKTQPVKTPEKRAPEKANALEDAEASGETGVDKQTVRLLENGAVRTLSMQEYLAEVLLSEMPADFEPEARKAQAVAARTFTCRKLERPKHDAADVCADALCCQAWTSREVLEEKYGASFDGVWQTAQEAVTQTAGEVLCYDGELIDAVYFSCSGGATEAAVTVWGSDVPYLQSVESPGEEAAPRFSSQVVLSPDEFAKKICEADASVPLDGPPDTWLGRQTRSEGGGVEALLIGGVSFSGVQLRKIFGLNSSKFTLAYEDGSFVFHVLGFGHRVGLSQYGAEHMAELGFSYRTILLYYYQGVTVERMGADA